MKRRLLFLSPLSLLVFFVFALSACDLASFTRPVPSLQDMPIYPGAQNVLTSVASTDYSKVTYITTFQAHATEEEVTSFYKDALTRKGWKYAEPRQPHVEGFYVDLSSKECIGGNDVEITLRTITPGLVAVGIRAWYSCGKA